MTNYVMKVMIMGLFCVSSIYAVNFKDQECSPSDYPKTEGQFRNHVEAPSAFTLNTIFNDATFTPDDIEITFENDTECTSKNFEKITSIHAYNGDSNAFKADRTQIATNISIRENAPSSLIRTIKKDTHNEVLLNKLRYLVANSDNAQVVSAAEAEIDSISAFDVNDDTVESTVARGSAESRIVDIQNEEGVPGSQNINNMYFAKEVFFGQMAKLKPNLTIQADGDDTTGSLFSISDPSEANVFVENTSFEFGSQDSPCATHILKTDADQLDTDRISFGNEDFTGDCRLTFTINLNGDPTAYHAEVRYTEKNSAQYSQLEFNLMRASDNSHVGYIKVNRDFSIKLLDLDKNLLEVPQSENNPNAVNP